MTVFVDDMRARYGRLILCHMIADSAEELHAMADRIGLARRWHQGDHYDVGRTRRARAVAAGAVEISQRHCALMALHRRRTGVLPGLDEVARLRQELAARVHQLLATPP